MAPFFVTWCNYRCWFYVGKALWRWFYPRSRKRDHFQTLATGVPKLKTWLGTQRVNIHWPSQTFQGTSSSSVNSQSITPFLPYQNVLLCCFNGVFMTRQDSLNPFCLDLQMIWFALPRGSVKNNMPHVALRGRGTTSAYNCFPATGLFFKFFASVERGSTETTCLQPRSSVFGNTPHPCDILYSQIPGVGVKPLAANSAKCQTIHVAASHLSFSPPFPCLQLKCHKYWPDEDKAIQYGPVLVKCVETMNLADFTIRSFDVSQVSGTVTSIHANW